MRNSSQKISQNSRILGRLLESTSLSTTKEKVLRQAQEKLSKSRKFLVTTQNPEMIMLALKNSDYRDLLLASEIKIPDGIGLWASHKFLSLPNPRNVLFRFFSLFAQGIYTGISIFVSPSKMKDSVIRGRDIFEDFIQLANKKSYRVVLFGGRNLVAEKTKEKLQESYKSVSFLAFSAPEYDENGVPADREESENESEIINKINEFKPHMLFIGISPPKELLFLKRNWDKLEFKMAMHVGQTFDVYSGKFKKAPDLIANLGLEWLWRFCTGSKSITRIWQSFPLFPLKVFWWKMRN